MTNLMADMVSAIIDEPDIDKRSEIGLAIMQKYTKLTERIIGLLQEDQAVLQDLMEKAEGIKK